VPAQAGAQLISLFIYAMIARWYVAPWLKSRGRADALIALLWVHVFRYVALQAFSAQRDGFPISDVGVVKTNIRREFPAWMKLLVPLPFDPLLRQTPEEAAEAALHLLLSKDLEGVSGALFLKITKLKRITPNATQLGRGEAGQLWELSERLTGQNLTWIAPQMAAVPAKPLA
jgi:hypothetical protein